MRERSGPPRPPRPSWDWVRPSAPVHASDRPAARSSGALYLALLLVVSASFLAMLHLAVPGAPAPRPLPAVRSARPLRAPAAIGPVHGGGRHAAELLPPAVVDRRPRRRSRLSALVETAKGSPLVLTTFAGASTGVGGLIAVALPLGARSLAALLGFAIGVMGTLSVVDLYVRIAIEYGALMATASAACGFALYLPLARLVALAPDPELAALELASSDADGGEAGGRDCDAARAAAAAAPAAADKPPEALAQAAERKRLHRLGLVMFATMTLHNLPEGVAVAMSTLSHLDFAPLMCVAVAVHNVPEGVVCAAPIFAATGSRSKAVALAFASGLSEPVGALLTLRVVHRFLTPWRLHAILAGVGGLMTAVCVRELAPEAAKSPEHRPAALAGGLGGAVIMGATILLLD